MPGIERIREAADFLLESKKYDLAFEIYDELTLQIWSAVGMAQQGMSDFTRNFLSNNFRSSVEFSHLYMEKTVGSLFVNWFNLDYEQIKIELIFILYGKIQCIDNSTVIRQQLNYEDVINDYLILYILVAHTEDPEWLKHILRVATPVIKSNKLSRLRNNLTEKKVETTIIEYSQQVKSTKWGFLNNLLTGYLNHSGKGSSHFSTRVNESADRSYRKYDYKKRESKQEESSGYRKYERYEKYEKYERYERSYSAGNEQDISGFNDEEKAKYYGQVLQLKGKVTKTHIRKQYLELISQYHPDKVDGLGPELKELANKKTKEINSAYQWMRQKFDL